ncbi:MAG: hypothetical protein ABIK98_05930 [Pseudomonadota bacterium]|uniref:Uncharacterized protein n=1 Tax=Candidatus Desulfatibia profunda TaxID=2841695 RepID=A0A8J6NP62_9BACT|nr:hypothetical protein [Candidatus Desulfatibia profunda]MBL7180643.1 hypothetical protein [Desulfobacterales bacterium]
MVSKDVNAPSLCCEFYQEQARYAFRVLALEREQAYLWDGWQEEKALKSFLKILLITPDDRASCHPLERFVGLYCFLFSAYMFEASC